MIKLGWTNDLVSIATVLKEDNMTPNDTKDDNERKCPGMIK